MKLRKRIVRLVAILLFWVGVLLGMALVAGTVWADIEATFYGFVEMGDKPLPLRCPTLVTAAQPGQIAAILRNPNDKPMELMTRTDVSGSRGIRTERATTSLAPRGREKVRWPVTERDVDLGFFIFARVSSFPAYPLPFRESTCGMLFIRTTALSGGQLFLLWVAAGLGCLAAGLILWQVGNQPLLGRLASATWAMRVLAAVVVIGMLVAFQGWWAVGIIAIVLMVLLIVAMMYLAAPD